MESKTIFTLPTLDANSSSLVFNLTISTLQDSSSVQTIPIKSTTSNFIFSTQGLLLPIVVATFISSSRTFSFFNFSYFINFAITFLYIIELQS
jgi:hypothetical protein